MDVNNFGPFDADVWGTFSDWIMVVVTSITLYFLSKTLVSQQKALLSQLEVQRLQQVTATIENERFRNEVKPNFDMTISKHNIEKLDDEIIIKMTLDFQLLGADCRNLDVNSTSVDGNLSVDHILPFGNAYLPSEAHKIMIIEYKSKKEVFDSFGMGAFFKFTFEDVVGNKYSQDIIISMNYTSHKIDVLRPLMQVAQTDSLKS